MSEPTQVAAHVIERLTPKIVSDAIATLVGGLPVKYRFVRYKPEPDFVAFIPVADLRKLTGDNYAAWLKWRNVVVRTRSHNESRLATLLWALREGDSFAVSAVRDWLRSEWGIDNPPTEIDHAFVARHCATTGLRHGVLDPDAWWDREQERQRDQPSANQDED